MIHSSIQEKIPEVVKFLKQNHVSRAYLFGSVCNEKFNDESDVDLLISFDESLNLHEYADHYWILDEELPKLFGRPVDLITERQLHNPYFIKVLNRTRTALYE
jgi:predicted nucleotidyltransferase